MKTTSIVNLSALVIIASISLIAFTFHTSPLNSSLNYVDQNMNDSIITMVKLNYNNFCAGCLGDQPEAFVDRK